MTKVQIHQLGAQGDVLFVRVDKLPKDAQKQERKGPIVVAMSETHHHHIVESPCAEYFTVPNDPFTAYLRLADNEPADVVHLRPFDTHQTISLPPNSIFLVRRQREYTPEGWRRVED